MSRTVAVQGSPGPRAASDDCLVPVVARHLTVVKSDHTSVTTLSPQSYHRLSTNIGVVVLGLFFSW